MTVEQGELKFRAWHRDSKKMFYFNRLWICSEYDSLAFEYMGGQNEYKLLAGHSGLPSNNEADYIFMRYTGLKDSKNIEECFGDLIKEGNCIRVIEDGCSAVIYKDVRTGTLRYFWELGYHEVIGNIWETPKLQESQEVNHGS